MFRAENSIMSESMEWVFSAYSHPGKVRNHEDYFYIPTGQTVVKNLIMVADGMGGHNVMI